MSWPIIIQGGMGVGVSGWKLASAVSQKGHLGVVAGTALATVLIRRLQNGDKEGVYRQAMKAFPWPAVVENVMDRYFCPGGKAETTAYRPHPFPIITSGGALEELTVLANFVEVHLAKLGHKGVVGINLLEKIQIPTLASLYGAMLAGVNYVLMGAGIPRAVPGVLDQLSMGQKASLTIEVEGGSSKEGSTISFDPAPHFDGSAPTLNRPHFLGIVSSNVLAQTLVKKASGRVDGLIIEGTPAGGHNAPPRTKGCLTQEGEPIYGPRDEVDLEKIRGLDRPFWLAGSYGRPGKLKEAQELGAVGLQVGTPFAFSDESGMAPEIKARIIAQSRLGEVKVFTDPLASPTGFPLKVVSLEGTLSQNNIFAERKRRCDVGYLRRPYWREDGTVGYRCPAEPQADFVRKGGSAEEGLNRKCVCNGLLATIGLGQIQPGGEPELPLVTAGLDARYLNEFIPAGRDSFTAEDVLNRVLQ